MVSLIERSKYNNSVDDNPIVFWFFSFIQSNQVNYHPDEESEIDKLYFDFLNSVSENSKGKFEENYNEISRRHPTSESPFVNNDFLIFTLICGVMKFNLDKRWLQEVLDQRTNLNAPFHSITHTFRNILALNFISTDNNLEIVIVFLNLLNRVQLSNEVLDITYLKISNNKNLFEKQYDFLTLISLRAYDVIVLTKETPDATEIKFLHDFKYTFLKRIVILSDIIYGIFFIGLIIFSVYLIKTHKGLNDYITSIGSILQLIGLGLFTIFFKWIRRKIDNFLKFAFGYSKVFKGKVK